MKHANAVLLEKIYADFAKSDFDAMLAACSDKMTFQVPGKSSLAGKYTKASFASGFAMKRSELSDGSIKSEVHDILASDLHAAVLATDKLVRNGQAREYRTVHIWRFEAGKPVAWYEYPRDLYDFDAVWS